MATKNGKRFAQLFNAINEGFIKPIEKGMDELERERIEKV
jgi:hypothetical protein